MIYNIVSFEHANYAQLGNIFNYNIHQEETF